jgi:hypothetical protein
MGDDLHPHSGLAPLLTGNRVPRASDARWPLLGCTRQGYTNLYKCAWQESNLLPFGPEPNALSGELQARDRFTSLEAAAA